MSHQRHAIWLLLFVLLVTFLAFCPSLGNPFCHIDDQVHLLENPSIRSFDVPHLKAMATRTVSKIYIPLTYFSYALEYKFFQYRPFIYHLDNLLLHLGVTAMVFILARLWGLGLPAAAGSSLLFGVHPMHVESVVWITERKDVLYSFFYLLAMYHYLRYLRFDTPHLASPTRKKVGTDTTFRKSGVCPYFYWSIFFALLSILSKPMALSLPLILGLCDWFQARRFSIKVFIDKIPYFLLIVPVAWVTYSLHARIPGRNIGEGSLIWLWSLTFYLKKFFSPWDVYPGYTMPKPISLFEPAYLTAVCVFLLLIFCLVWLRKDRWFIFAVGYYFASIFFLLRYDDVWDANMVADRFMYLPCLGFCLWLGSLAGKIFTGGISKRAGTAAALGIFTLLALLSIKTFSQSRLWGKEMDLWSYVLKREPHSFFAYNSRGNLFTDIKDYDSAISDYSMAIRLRPNYALAYNNRGLAYYHIGEKGLALRDFNMCLALNYSNEDYAHVNRGLLYSDMGQYDLALKDFNKAIELNPDNPYAYNNRGRVYFFQRRYDLALEDFNKTVELKPDLVKAYVSRGNVYLAKNLLDLAMKEYNLAIRHDPSHAGAFYNRSILQYQKKNYQAALDDVMRARQLGYRVQDSYVQMIKKGMDNREVPAK